MTLRKKLTLLAILVLICYIPTLGYGFTSDDVGAIATNPQVGDFGFAFTRPQAALRSLMYSTIFTISGLSPILYRLLNVVFHIGSVFILYAIVRALGFDRIALLAASLFAVHPLVTESVTWISGGVYSQYGFFFLGAFFFYITSKENNKKYLLSLLFFILSLWSNEKAVVFPIVIVWYELCLGSIKERYKKTLLFFGISGLFGLLYTSFIGQRIQAIETSFYQKNELLNPFFQIPVAISTYLSLFFVPIGLTFYHSELTFSGVDYAIRAISFLFFLGVIGFAFIKQKFIAFWLGFFIIILLPTLTPLPIAWVVAERYVYLGVGALCVVIGWMLEKIISRKKTKYIGYGIYIVILLMLMVLTISRNKDWRNQDTLWLATAVTSPKSPQNHNNLGDYYARQGNVDQAIVEFKRATELNPGYADAFHNLANTYQQKGDFENATNYYKKALSINPNIWQSYQNMAYIYFMQNKFTDAENALRSAIKIAPQEISIKRALAIVLTKQHRDKEAKEILENL